MRTMRRRLIPFVVVASLAGGAVAQAAIPSGTYSGKMSDGAAVTLKVDKTKKLVRVVRKGLKFTCTDGDSFTSLKSTATGTVDVSSGKFDIADTEPDDGVTWQMTGKFSSKKRKVKGTYSETRTFNTSDQLDPDGSVSCKTAALTYSAVLPKKT